MSEEAVEFYRLEKVRIEPAKPGEFRLSTAAAMDCSLCGRMIDGMGGGETAICVPCGDEIHKGSFRGCVKWEQE